ncbi:MAG: hypothetical protein ACF8MJ_00960 [Phycisphaerales bacterium JB050]
MKLIAYLIITASVIVGSLASATAYLAPIDTPDEKLIGLELTSDAGAYMPEDVSKEFKDRLEKIHKAIDEKKEAAAKNPLKPKPPVSEEVGDEDAASESADDQTPVEDEATEADDTDPEEPKTEPTGESKLADAENAKPIGREGDTLNAELLEILREQQVEYLKVNRFDFFRWPHWWLFVISSVGLLGGAFLVRRAQKAELARSGSLSETENPTDARTVFARLSGRLDELSKDLERASTEDEKLEAIVRRIGNIQRDDVPAFVADRPALVNRLSLGGYAELMDHFAGMERQLNRAWSAAADGYLDEALNSLKNAQPMLIQTLEKLKG